MEVLAYIADDEKKLKLIEELERYLKIATLFDIKDRMYLIEWLQGYLGRLKGKTIVQALISALERMNEDNDYRSACKKRGKQSSRNSDENTRKWLYVSCSFSSYRRTRISKTPKDSRVSDRDIKSSSTKKRGV